MNLIGGRKTTVPWTNVDWGSGMHGLACPNSEISKLFWSRFGPIRGLGPTGFGPWIPIGDEACGV